MPVKITALGRNRYRVSTPSGVKSKATTKAKAEKQKVLLNAIEHGFRVGGDPLNRGIKFRTKSRYIPKK